MAGENSVYTWVRDHRTHHKYSETTADPHDARRGFLFAHIGWLCMRKHPRVISGGKTINMTDLEADPLVMFQHRHYGLFFFLFAIFLPTLIPCILDMALSGRRALRVLMVLNAWMPPAPSRDAVKLIRDTWGVSRISKAESFVSCTNCINKLQLNKNYHNKNTEDQLTDNCQ